MTERASRWLPETNAQTHQIVGKLGEEASELASICCRILIQGIDGADPDTGKPNLQALIEEISDVSAMIEVLEARKGWFVDRKRVERKFNLKMDWLDQILDTTGAPQGRRSKKREQAADPVPR